MEKALICERLGWRVLPWDLDDVDIDQVRGPLEELYAYRVAQQYGKDLNKLDEKEAEFMGWIEKARRMETDE